MTVTHQQASENILAFLEQGRLRQRTWDGIEKGKHVACLLGAAGGFMSIRECPAELMPAWLAECTVIMFDGLALEDVAPIAKRYGELIGKWSVISDDGWSDVLARWLVRLIDQAVESVPAYAKAQPYWPVIARASEQCKMVVVEKAANVAHVDHVANAARAARVAARVAANYTYSAAYYAAYNVYSAAYYAANAAYSAANVANAARAAAYSAAYKSLFTALLDEIERAIMAKDETGNTSNGQRS